MLQVLRRAKLINRLGPKTVSQDGQAKLLSLSQYLTHDVSERFGVEGLVHLFTALGTPQFAWVCGTSWFHSTKEKL